MKYILLILFSFPLHTIAQDSVSKISVKYIDQVAEKADKVSAKVLQRSEKAVKAFQQQEHKIYRKLLEVDSNRANAFVMESKERYAALTKALGGKIATRYLGSFDTLKTSISFLQANQNVLSGKDQDQKLMEARKSVEGLEGSLGAADLVRDFLRDRRSQLKSKLDGWPISQELKSLNKEAYYYSAQIKEYKALLSDKKKVEKKAIALLLKSNPFKEFMAEHSYLASLFKMPSSAEFGNLRRLQTRSQVNASIQQQISTGGGTGSAQFTEGISQAKKAISELKQKVLVSGQSSEDLNMPEGFKPNSQKTKSLFKRLEVGSDVQTRKSNRYFPITSDLSFSLGYKITDRTVAGVGGSYKLGLGTGWDNIEFTSEGMAFRSFLEWRAKGNFWTVATYEVHHYSNLSVNERPWKESALAGISKRYKIKNKEGYTQVLFDFFANKHHSNYSPFQFRIGYKF